MGWGWDKGRRGMGTYRNDLCENEGDCMTNSAYFADRMSRMMERMNVTSSAVRATWWVARVGWPLYLFGLREGLGVRIRVFCSPGLPLTANICSRECRDVVFIVFNEQLNGRARPD